MNKNLFICVIALLFSNTVFAEYQSCEQKIESINNKIVAAKKYENYHQLKNLEKALSEVESYCVETSDNYQDNVKDKQIELKNKINEKQNKIKEIEQDVKYELAKLNKKVLKAEQQGKNNDINEYQTKIIDEKYKAKTKIEKLQNEINDLEQQITDIKNPY